MSFMQPQIVFGKWLVFETRGGVEVFPDDLIPEHRLGVNQALFEEDDPERFNSLVADIAAYRQHEGRVYFFFLREGYGARLSAPGYLDCTEWVVFDSKKEAKKYLLDLQWGEDDDDDDN